MSTDWSQRHRRWKQLDEHYAGAADHEHFADDIMEMTKMQPQRFANLALKIPETVNSKYIKKILWGLMVSGPKPDEQKNASEGKIGPPATPLQIEKLLLHVGYVEDKELATRFCDLMKKWAEISWSPEVLELLVRYACEHSDPEKDVFLSRYNKNREEIPDVETTSLNCVRGCAAGAIMSILFAHPSLFSVLEHAIDKLVADPSPAVRLAAIRACVPILNIDRDLAVEYFLRACHMEDDRIFQNRTASTFIRYSRHTHLDEIEPVIERMVLSDIPELASEGASWVCAVWLESGKMEKLMQECLSGTIQHRKGIASVMADWVQDKKYEKECKEILKILFFDKDEEIGETAAECFREQSLYNSPDFLDFGLAFVDSPAFLKSTTELIEGLSEYPCSLKPFGNLLLRMADIFSNSLVHDARNMQTSISGDARRLTILLLRLYEQSQQPLDRNLQIRCLDALDNFVRLRIGGTYSNLDKSGI